MNRRGFLAAIAGVAIAPQILEQLREPEFDITETPFLRKLQGSSTGLWTFDVRTGPPLSLETLKKARENIWASHAQPTVYDRRIYERTGLLVPL